jgi:hypothetical protein
MSKCIIDNWSLEYAAELLENGLKRIQGRKVAEHLDRMKGYSEGGVFPMEEVPSGLIEIDTPTVYLSALSNLLNGIVLFDQLVYVANGFEGTWRRYAEFEKKIHKQVDPLNPAGMPDSVFYSDLVFGGIAYYLEMSKIHSCDVLLNVYRSTQLTKNLNLENLTYKDYIDDLLKSVDSEVKKKLDKSSSPLMRLGALANLRIPPIMHFVLSNSSSRNDILETAFQIRDLKTMKSLREKMDKIASSASSADQHFLLISELDEIAGNLHREIYKGGISGSLGLSIPGISIGFGWKKKRCAKDHRMFLKKLLWCRMEMNGAKKSIDRILVH